MAESKSGRGGLTVIAVFKLVKAVGLVAIGVIALTIADRGSVESLAHWGAIISFAPGHKLVGEAIAKIGGLEPRQLSEVGIGAFVYAAVFVVEGVGLLRQKRWAEYVTTLVTLSFVPLELYELVERVTVMRFAALAANVAIVGYLVLRLRRERVASSPDRAAG